MKKPSITTHVLDVSRGKPAEGVEIRLEFLSQNQWKSVGQGITNSDGRIEALTTAPQLGQYRLEFQTGKYFQGRGMKAFYPSVVIQFEVMYPEDHYHVPLLLSPFGYSTYRGS